MASDLLKTWNDAASRWDDWGPPLRPCAEDIHLMRNALSEFCAQVPNKKQRVLLYGVTPEIVTMDWPCAIDLIAMDQSQRMVELVWPGDIAGVRRAIVSNWLNPGLPAGSQDVIFNDGGFGFFAYPDKLCLLLAAMRNILRPGGMLICRDFVQVEQRESTQQVLDATRRGEIGNFHAFKWRLAMSLQTDTVSGVCQHDVWQTWNDAQIDPSQLPQPGWSSRAVSTVEFYRGKETRLCFPTLKEFKELLSEYFEQIKVQIPSYELGDRCPILTAVPRGQ